MYIIYVYTRMCVCPNIHIHRERDFKELAHVILEPWQVHSLQGKPAGRRPREEPEGGARGRSLREEPEGGAPVGAHKQAALWRVICFPQSLLIQMLLSPKNILTVTSRITFDQIPGDHSLAKLTYEINHHHSP